MALYTVISPVVGFVINRKAGRARMEASSESLNALIQNCRHVQHTPRRDFSTCDRRRTSTQRRHDAASPELEALDRHVSVCFPMGHSTSRMTVPTRWKCCGDNGHGKSWLTSMRVEVSGKRYSGSDEGFPLMPPLMPPLLRNPFITHPPQYVTTIFSGQFFSPSSSSQYAASSYETGSPDCSHRRAASGPAKDADIDPLYIALHRPWLLSARTLCALGPRDPYEQEES